MAIVSPLFRLDLFSNRRSGLGEEADWGVESVETEARHDGDLDPSGLRSTMKMKLDHQTAKTLIKAAMRQGRAPGKYDVFAWVEDQKLRSLTVAWKSYTRRSIALEGVSIDGGEEIPTNAAPLPNGMERNSARYVGSFRIDGTAESKDA
jgi:hypothetical protein